MTQRGTIVSKVGTVNTDDPLDFTTAFAHNCSTTGDVEDVLVPLALRFTAGPCEYDLDGVVLSRTTLSFSDFDVPVAPDFPPDFGNNGGGNGQGNGFGATNVVYVLDKVEGVSTDVHNIQTKTDLISITQSVDLDDVEAQADRLKSLPTSPATPRLLVVGTNGNLSALSDGTNGQALTTDGSGGYSFATVGGGSGRSEVVIVANAGRHNLTRGGFFYFGDSLNGWTARSWTASMANSSPYLIPAADANNGLIIPKALTNLSFKASVLSETTRDNVTVALFMGARPNGGTRGITLTRVVFTTISIASANVQYNADMTVTGTFREGDIVLPMILRSGTTTSSAQHQFMYNLVGW